MKNLTSGLGTSPASRNRVGDMVVWQRLRRVSLTHWILFSMAAGVLIGALFPEGSQNLKVISTVFLRLIKCILVPLVFGTLVVGIAGHADDLKAVGRLALKAIFYFEVVTTLALAIGLLAVNLARPGDGLTLPPPAAGTSPVAPAPVTFSGILEHLVPKSFFEAAAANDVLQVVVFALMFGVALAQVQGAPRQHVLNFCEGLTEVMFKFTGIVMKFAPFGIGAAMAVTVGHGGLGVLFNLARLILTLYVALAVFCVVVLWPMALWARVPVRKFLGLLKEPILVAFTTTSSDAAMPEAMKRLVAFGVPKKIVSFVMPLGYSFNLDGSTLYLAVASVFVAQAANIELSLGQQLVMMLTLMLTSKGMAGIPRASQVILAGTLVTFHLPLEGVALIIGVDELMDMGRTTVNLVGNCLATAVMARAEGEKLQPPKDSTEPCADKADAAAPRN
ncbi:MAG TPA: cation:dicarboxylase symporter family transporter [Verrucomicrobiota bacterium]|nr:cation:dicarboxylase symporter family transporter [Verrucomicrobiota bacterium]